MSVFDRFSARELAEEIAPLVRQLLGAARRVGIDLTSKARWMFVGHEKVTEKFPAEPFTGMGFYSRPPTDGTPEAIVLFIGGPRHGVAVATRDEKTRAAIAGALASDETAVFNSQAIVHVTAGGQIHARSAAGVAVPLATKADLDALASYVRNQFSTAGGHSHAVVGAATTTTTAVAVPGTAPAAPVPAAAGTQVFKGE